MNFNIRLFCFLSGGFILFTVIGTLSHEFGHYTAGRFLGFKSTIHYQYTRPLKYNHPVLNPEDKVFLDSIYSKYAMEMRSKLPYPGKQKVLDIYKKYSFDQIWFTLGGPLQTILTGTIGVVLILIFYKRFRNKDHLSPGQWLLVFMALFWLRQVANLLTGLTSFIMTGKTSLRSDEPKLDAYFGLPHFTLEIITSLIALSVLYFITFKVVPKTDRFTFLAAGLFGGAAGSVLWFKILGPIVMP